MSTNILTPRTNWSQNILFTSPKREYPSTLDQLRTIIQTNTHVHVIGTGHCFNNIADTNGVMINLKNMNTICTKDPDTVFVEAGVTYSDLRRKLFEVGRAIMNFPSLPHLNIIGSIVTGTHGGAKEISVMADLVEEFSLMDGTGKVHKLMRSDPRFFKILVGLGYLGVVVSVRLKTLSAFEIQKSIYKNVNFAKFKNIGTEIFSYNEYTSLFIDPKVKEISSVWFGKVITPSSPPSTQKIIKKKQNQITQRNK
jgi:xylitol oxidase